MNDNNESITILICGGAGQGIETVELLLTKIFKTHGFNIYATKEYMSRVRGGSNSIEIRISAHAIRAPFKYADMAVLLDKDAVKHIAERITESTVVIRDKTTTGASEKKIIDVPFSKIAESIGNKVYSNVVAVGVICGIIKVDTEKSLESLNESFKDKSPEVIENNAKAIRKGYEIADELIASGTITAASFMMKIAEPGVDENIICNGDQSIAMGALAGGCNMVSSYPMSPSTGVLVYLAGKAERFNLIVEQAEDEISAINMAIGAWYAGGRALVTTSGGGFSLMAEGISLSGMIEVPVVVHVASRPGPATGLPTRTEQADLDLVLYAGHGEFPRAIFAPGSIEETFICAQRAFYIADKYQVPVFILTDQYLTDSYYNCPPFTIPKTGYQNNIVETNREYNRYRITADGVSPRGIPGYGEGIVMVDSDEHDEEGCTTEDLKIRVKMNDKRLKKLKLITKDAREPELTGNTEYSTLLLSWGSTYHIVKEALELLKRKDVSLLHFNQVYPVHKDVSKYLIKAKKSVVIENNATSQFGKLIESDTGIDIDRKILKYNGLPFFVDELAEILTGVI